MVDITGNADGARAAAALVWTGRTAKLAFSGSAGRIRCRSNSCAQSPLGATRWPSAIGRATWACLLGFSLGLTGINLHAQEATQYDARYNQPPAVRTHATDHRLRNVGPSPRAGFDWRRSGASRRRRDRRFAVACAAPSIAAIHGAARVGAVPTVSTNRLAFRPEPVPHADAWLSARLGLARALAANQERIRPLRRARDLAGEHDSGGGGPGESDFAPRQTPPHLHPRRQDRRGADHHRRGVLRGGKEDGDHGARPLVRRSGQSERSDEGPDAQLHGRRAAGHRGGGPGGVGPATAHGGRGASV